MLLKRWVTYIYKYDSGQRRENAGFIKVQGIDNSRGVTARIQIGLKIYKNKPCLCKLYLVTADGKINKLEETHINAMEKDAIVIRLELMWNNPVGDGIPVNEYAGIFFLCDDGDKYLAMWNENAKIRIEEPEEQEKQEKQEKVDKPEGEDVDKDGDGEGEAVGGNYGEVSGEDEESCADSSYINFKDLYSDNPKLELDESSQLDNAIKIKLQDIGKLPVMNWGLVRNSFLMHNYRIFGYLLVCRDKKSGRWVIGIPSVFSNKERYIAHIYGFDIFVTEKSEQLLTGKQGYWLSDIVME